MYLVFYLQVCFVLVSSNPLYDFSCCPNTHPSYGNDQPLIVQRSNYNPYSQDLLVHNRWNPITNSQSVPQQYQYLNTNNFIPNYQLYNQNGLDIQHVPETETEKVINNYILIPEDYFNNIAIENERYKKIEAEIRKTNNTKNNKRNKSKRRRPDISAKIYNDSDDITKTDTKTTKSKGCKEETERPNSGRTRSKKKNNKNKILTTDVEEILPIKTIKNHGEALIKNTNNHLMGSCGKKNIERNKSPTNKPNYQEPKTTKGSKKEEVVNDYIPDVNKKSKKKDGTGFSDVKVCFDINEDCADLDCRHTRNKDVNIINKPQSPNSTPHLPNNLNNYMNGFTFNQQMDPNIFNPNVNFPFNFDYLYQMPQTSNVQPKESNNRRRSRKRKQQSSNRTTNLNKKNKNVITTVHSCDKVVELTPEIPKFETTTIATDTITNAEEQECENVVQEEPTLEKDQESNLENPTRTLITEVLSNDEITNNNNVPLDNYNDVIDEYYPDFTLDNTYMSSKEDYDFSNFHDRYYYAYGDKPELNRERRKYEHPKDNKLNRHTKINISNKNIVQEPSQIQEIICETDTSKEKLKFLTPSVLEFPGFKTEMINKEKYFAKDEHRSKNYKINQSTNRICPSSKHAEDEGNEHNHNVETVFANSKVVKYGGPQKEEIILKVPEPEVKKEFKNLISNDGKTTVVIAKSLGYSK